jgi:transcriptional regulator with XRE-family HTH domain
VARPLSVDPETLNPTARKIGSRIRAARTRAGLSQTALAKQIGATQSQLSRWEIGHIQPPNTRLDAISAATGAPVAFLLGDTRWDQLDEPTPLAGDEPAGPDPSTAAAW